MSARLTLAEDARDADGRLLLPRGAHVTEDDLGSLSRRGATALLLMDADPAEEDPQPSPDAAAVQRRLDRLFRHCADDDAPARMLRECLLRYRLASQ